MLERHSFDVVVEEETVRRFGDLTGDRNPLHLDPDYASGTEFGRPIAHGVLLLGFVSRLVGMHIPGRRCVILSIKARFPTPLRYPARISVEGRLSAFNAERGTGTVTARIAEAGSRNVV